MDSNIYRMLRKTFFSCPPLLQAINRVWMERLVHRPELSHQRCPAALRMRLPRSFGRQKGGLSHWGLVGLSTISCTRVFFSNIRGELAFGKVNFWTINQCFLGDFEIKKQQKKLGVAWVKFLYKKPFHLGCFVAHMFFLKLPHIIRGAPPSA